MNCYKYLLCIIFLFSVSGLYQYYKKTNECQYALDKCDCVCVNNDVECYIDCLRCIEKTTYDCCEYIFPGQKICNKVKTIRNNKMVRNHSGPMRPKTYLETLEKYIKLKINQSTKN